MSHVLGTGGRQDSIIICFDGKINKDDEMLFLLNDDAAAHAGVVLAVVVHGAGDIVWDGPANFCVGSAGFAGDPDARRVLDAVIPLPVGCGGEP